MSRPGDVLRVVVGIDPGRTGAVGVIADGRPVAAWDMPHKAQGDGVCSPTLAGILRSIRGEYIGADLVAYLEHVSAWGGDARRQRAQGIASTGEFLRAAGVAEGVLGALGIRTVLVRPATWKSAVGVAAPRGSKLSQAERKERGRLAAIERWPGFAHHLARKKDNGRADALLIAHHGFTCES
jgi:hypothetical protein